MADKNLYLVPASNKEVRDATRVLLSGSGDQPIELGSTYANTTDPVWPVRDVIIDEYQISNGDFCLCYTGNETYGFVGEVRELIKIQGQAADEFRDRFFGNQYDKDIHLLVFEWVDEIALPSSKIADLANYQMDYIISFSRLDNSVVTQLCDYFGSLSTFITQLRNDDLPTDWGKLVSDQDEDSNLKLDEETDTKSTDTSGDQNDSIDSVGNRGDTSGSMDSPLDQNKKEEICTYESDKTGHHGFWTCPISSTHGDRCALHQSSDETSSSERMTALRKFLDQSSDRTPKLHGAHLESCNIGTIAAEANISGLQLVGAVGNNVKIPSDAEIKELHIHSSDINSLDCQGVDKFTLSVIESVVRTLGLNNADIDELCVKESQLDKLFAEEVTWNNLVTLDCEIRQFIAPGAQFHGPFETDLYPKDRDFQVNCQNAIFNDGRALRDLLSNTEHWTQFDSERVTSKETGPSNYSERRVRFKFDKIVAEETDLSGVSCKGVSFRSATFQNADLRDANLEKITARDADFSGSDLRDASLVNSDLHSAIFKQSTVRYATVTDCEAEYAKFDSADLRHATFSETDLAHSNFDGADLRFLILEKCGVYETTFEGVKINSQAEVSSETLYDTTIEELSDDNADTEGLFMKAAATHWKLHRLLSENGLYQTVRGNEHDAREAELKMRHEWNRGRQYISPDEGQSNLIRALKAGLSAAFHGSTRLLYRGANHPGIVSVLAGSIIFLFALLYPVEGLQYNQTIHRYKLAVPTLQGVFVILGFSIKQFMNGLLILPRMVLVGVFSLPLDVQVSQQATPVGLSQTLAAIEMWIGALASIPIVLILIRRTLLASRQRADADTYSGPVAWLLGN